AGGGLEVHARGPRVVGGGGARVAVGPCAEVPVDVAVLVQHPRGELGGSARSVGAHHRADGGGRQVQPGVVGGDRGVVPPGDAAGEDLGDHLPGQPQVGDLGVADPEVVHEGGAARHDGHVGVAAVAWRVVGAGAVLHAVGDLGDGEVHDGVGELLAAGGGAVARVVDAHVVLRDVGDPLVQGVLAPRGAGAGD